jgi:membrane-associated protease RseP (regulator of RpoE activity)
MVIDHNLAELDALVGQFFNINEITYGSAKQPFIARYRGSLKESDSQAAYDHIAEALASHQIVPLIRREEDQVNIYLMPEMEKKKPLNPRVNLILFILTLFSVLITGGLYGFQGEPPKETWKLIWELMKNGWPFAITLLTILGAHEFGHYFAGRKHGVQVTLPYFIPLPYPLSLFGTMGAFINMRSLPKNRRDLFDVGIAGPRNGMIVSIIAMIIGLSLSKIGQLPQASSTSGTFWTEGNSIIYLLLKFIRFGKLLPQPENISGISLLVYWVRFFFTGQPYPWGATDVMLHPVTSAGWVGLFVNSFNLIPAGQLDGGHIFYTLFGEKTTKSIFPFIIACLVLLGFFSNNWWLLAVLIFIFGRIHAEPLDQITELDRKRKLLGYIAILVFVLTFIPVPMTIV